MDDQPKPMLNSPIETDLTVGEEFAENVLGRLDRMRGERYRGIPTETPQQIRERMDKFNRLRKEGIAARKRDQAQNPVAEKGSPEG